MITILGAGGAIGNELVKLLAARGQPIRLVGRKPRETPGATETVSADITDKDQTIRAVAGSSVVHLLVGLKYDHKCWQELWPRVMSNTIEACKRAGAKLVFFDNVYMYGRVSGPMTEETPFNPCSKKGDTRAKIATTLINEWTSGALTGMIARSADFYGPGARNGVANVLVFEPFSRQQKASWLVNDAVPHSYTYAPDAAQSLVLLAEWGPAWNQTWHVPTTPHPLTGRAFVSLAATALGVAPKYRVLSKPMIRLAGWFNPLVAESYEMLYQSESPYLFDSSKFARRFGFAGTPYADGIRTTAASFRRSNKPPRSP
ncbi:MAG TPA: NAD-dependent epimerase/dehydratase family protein [bacterium]|nr:NAD-dependent epimerase/dehydratase family protein [bacterium]